MLPIVGAHGLLKVACSSDAVGSTTVHHDVGKHERSVDAVKARVVLFIYLHALK